MVETGRGAKQVGQKLSSLYLRRDVTQCRVISDSLCVCSSVNSGKGELSDRGEAKHAATLNTSPLVMLPVRIKRTDVLSSDTTKPEIFF